MDGRAPGPDVSPADPDPDPVAHLPPAANETQVQPRMTRRAFVIRAMTALGALAAALVAIPVAAFVSAPGWLSAATRRFLPHTVSPALRSEEWTSAGPVDRFRIGTPEHTIVQRPIVDGWVMREAPVGVFVLRETDVAATVFDPHCTHLGCPVEYSSGSGAFLCPCHGGSFDPEGYPTGGPPPRRLDVYETRVTEGEIFFRKIREPEG